MRNNYTWLRQADMARKYDKTRSLMAQWLDKGWLIKKTGEGGVLLVKESAVFDKESLYRSKN